MSRADFAPCRPLVLSLLLQNDLILVAKFLYLVLLLRNAFLHLCLHFGPCLLLELLQKGFVCKLLDSLTLPDFRGWRIRSLQRRRQLDVVDRMVILVRLIFHSLIVAQRKRVVI